jgi:hypothetical protein
MRMDDMTLTLDTAGIAVGAAWTRSRPLRGAHGHAGQQQLRDRVAVVGGAH